MFITDLGVVLVDTKLAGWGQPLMDKIKTVTTKPVTTIINTHTHGDHNGSNDSSARRSRSSRTRTPAGTWTRWTAFKGSKVNFLPKLMFKDKMSLGAGKEKIELYYFGAGHTNGDAWVVFPALRVMHAGDLFAGKELPPIDGNNGGSGLAYPETLAKAAARQERRHHHHRAQHDDDDGRPGRIRALQSGFPRPGDRRLQPRPQRRRGDRTLEAAG